MAISIQTQHDGERNLVVNAKITDNAGGDYVDQVLLSASSFSPAPKTLRLQYIQTSALGANAVLDSDGTTNATIVNLPDGESVFDYSKMDSLENKATNPTGDILITTAGLGAGKSITIYMEMIKT